MIHMSRTRRVVRGAVKAVARKTPPTKQIIIKCENLRAENDRLNQQLDERLKMRDVRMLLSHQFLDGKGLEIGALHMPTPLPPGVKAKYVDYISVAKLRKQYPELRDLPLVNVDIVDNGERLTKVKDSSVNFIIANHFFEHCQDPIGTLITFYKKLRGNGILYMAIPDKRYTFDMHRPLTSYAHLLEEHKIYPSKKFYKDHVRETARLGELLKSRKDIEARTQELIGMNYSIHYHVWTQKEMVEFFYKTAEKFSLDIEIAAMVNHIHEVIFVIRKRDPKYEARKVKDIEEHYFGDRKP
jgi:predicted SAM-dependent methyltransferase